MNNKNEIPVNMPHELQAGIYANNMAVTHNKEEFVIDFMFMDPQMGQVVSRIITSPGHMKRIVSALQENLAKYELRIGNIQESDAPEGKLRQINPSKDKNN